VATPKPGNLTIELPWRTILKVFAALALVWLWFELWELVLLLIVAVLLSVALDPVVCWVERRGLGRGMASTLVLLLLLLVGLAFAVLASSSLSSQGQLMVKSVQQFERTIVERTPAVIRNAISRRSSGNSDLESYVASLGLSTISSLLNAAVVLFLSLILTLYLLIEGEQTAAWLLAFVPVPQRPRARQTMVEARRVMLGYVAGNAATSFCAALFVLILLSVLGVPAAFLIALLAGVLDFLPVIGFPLSAAPALLLATTVSGRAVVIIAVLYVAYHTFENYVISPWVYGDRLKLSNLAVILAFAVGAQIGGVIGALIALPAAAVYPAVERIWLRDRVGQQTVDEHRAIEDQGAD
jgi:predicted PurR-regulated permease PerM